MLSAQVTVGQVLRALVTMQGLVIEWVTVKAFHEDFTAENGKVRRVFDVNVFVVFLFVS